MVFCLRHFELAPDWLKKNSPWANHRQPRPDTHRCSDTFSTYRRIEIVELIPHWTRSSHCRCATTKFLDDSSIEPFLFAVLYRRIALRWWGGLCEASRYFPLGGVLLIGIGVVCRRNGGRPPSHISKWPPEMGFARHTPTHSHTPCYTKAT